LARQLQAELSSVLDGEVDDPRIANVTVTGVEVSKDLRHARVFVHSPDRPEKREELLGHLTSARGFLRAQLSLRLSHLRRTPELTFSYDRSIEDGQRIEELLAGFQTPPPDAATEE
jgi:ribosome-binding factor A